MYGIALPAIRQQTIAQVGFRFKKTQIYRVAQRRGKKAEKLRVPVRVRRMRRTQSKIPEVAIFASERIQ